MRRPNQESQDPTHALRELINWFWMERGLCLQSLVCLMHFGRQQRGRFASGIIPAMLKKGQRPGSCGLANRIPVPKYRMGAESRFYRVRCTKIQKWHPGCQLECFLVVERNLVMSLKMSWANI